MQHWHGYTMTVQAPSTKPAVKNARMATKGSGTPVKETGTDRPRGAPPAGKGAGLAAQSRGATRKDAVSPALSAKVPGANLSKSAQKRVRKKVRPSLLCPVSCQCEMHANLQRRLA